MARFECAMHSKEVSAGSLDNIQRKWDCWYNTLLASAAHQKDKVYTLPPKQLIPKFVYTSEHCFCQTADLSLSLAEEPFGNRLWKFRLGCGSLCIMRPPNHPKFRSSKSTETDGLSVRLRCMGRNIPFHMGAPTFNQAAQTMQGTPTSLTVGAAPPGRKCSECEDNRYTSEHCFCQTADLSL